MKKEKSSSQIAKEVQYKLLAEKYKIGLLVNSGGYGHVFYAQDASHTHRYAIKAISLDLEHKEPQRRDKIRQALQREGEMMTLCKSQFTMKCHEVLECDHMKMKFIVMDLCEFGSLENFICLKGHLSQQEAKIILKHTLCGLAQIHRNGLYHRDIKSSNVCFNNSQCVICDFGCSKEFLTQDQLHSCRSSVRKQGTVTGTMINQSPEMLAKEEYGFKTDLWAIGILFYEMLTGTPPFIFDNDVTDEKALEEIKDKIKYIFDIGYIKDNLKRQEMQDRGSSIISPDAKEFLKKLIVFDQKQRYSWKDLSSHQYLLVDKQPKDCKIRNCILPLKDINWSEFVPQIQILCQPVTKTKNQKKRDPNCKVVKVKKQLTPLSQDERQLLNNNAVQMNNRQQAMYQQRQILDFQIARIKMLKQLRGYFQELQKSHKDIKCDKVGLLILMFCFLKSKEIQNDVNNNNLQLLKEKLHINQWVLEIKGIYEADKMNFKLEHKEGPLNLLKSLTYDQKKEQFYQQIDKESFTTVESHIRQETIKLYERIRKQVKPEQLKHIEFFEHSQTIIKAQYKPDKKNGKWQHWKDFASIFEYESEKKNTKS